MNGIQSWPRCLYRAPGRECIRQREKLESAAVCWECESRTTFIASDQIVYTAEEPKKATSRKRRTLEEDELRNILDGQTSQKEEARNLEAETRERKKRLCKTCIYHIGGEAGIYCDYLAIVGKKRPCPAEECETAGVYIREGKRRSLGKTWRHKV